MKVGYARVSTRDQSPQLQLDALKSAGCKKVYTEKASGARLDRPKLEEALDYLREGDALVVWKLDRLARSTKQLIDTMGILRERKIQLISLTEQIDTSTAMGELIFHIFAGLAQFERSLIQERTNAGLESARRMGRVGGAPAKLSATDIKMVVSLSEQDNVTQAEIAARFKVSRWTIRRVLAKEVTI
jgi:DNA invertase Pin-like site-specific DNA recombinase